MNLLTFANNAVALTAAAIGTGDTSLTLPTGKGALFPALSTGYYFVGTLSDSLGVLIEIVWVTARSGDTLTITRAREGTTAQAWPAGSVFENLMTAGQLAALPQWDAISPIVTVDLGAGGSTATVDLASYNFEQSWALLKLTASVSKTLTDVTGITTDMRLTLMVQEGSSPIAIAQDTPPFFIANISGPLGWPGTPLDSISFLHMPENTSYKWVEIARNWRIS